MSDPLIRVDYLDNIRPLIQTAADRLGLPTLDMIRRVQDIIRRLGGVERDYITELQEVAYESKALVLAAQASAGAALGYTTNPADPLSYTNTTETAATVTIAAHTRSTAGAPLVAGSLAGLTRGVAQIIYYSDAANAGGAVTYLATSDPRILVSTDRVVGAIYLPSPPVRALTV